MDTVRVNICYRPLRICWAIAAGDLPAYRKAIGMTYTMWGGRFNPIAIVDRLEEAERIVEVFRADIIVPVGDSDAVKDFQKRFPHLISPLFPDGLFIGSQEHGFHAHILDVHNALVDLTDSPALKSIREKGLRLYSWENDDPLADVFLMQFGQYPDVADTGLDYRAIVKEATAGTEHPIDRSAPIPKDVFEHPSVAYLSRHGLRRHYGIQSNWDFGGFYLGDANNLDDLVSCWNLRAVDTSLFFVDRKHLSRYEEVIPAWSKLTKERLSTRRFEHHRNVAVWARREAMPADHNEHAADLKALFGEGPFTICGIDTPSWNGLNVQAPMMILGETAQLGVLMTDGEKPKLSFALGDKPFYDDTWFHTQHLVASLSFIGGLYGDDLHTLVPPYIPELNEFYARAMHFQYNHLRIEPDRIGLVIDAADSDAFIYALPVASMFERIFKLAGFTAKPSAGGLITRQIISQLGGLRGASVFKIPGVRRLLKTFGPTDAFTARTAAQLIGGKDNDDPGSTSFKDFEDDLYIEQREIGTKLRAPDVFTYLVAKGLFRIGSQLTCPHCRMASWTALDNLKQRVVCEMCGREFDATRQLVAGESHYRRSGVLGAERNAQGAVPVTLTLQQLEINLGHGIHEHAYSTSLDLVPIDNPALPACEVDFVWLVNGRFPEPTTIILAECKDRGRKKGGDSTIDAKDISNLKAVADALPSKRFEPFILLAKLCPFTQEEIDAAKTLNSRWTRRAILLTPRELEPWHIYQRTNAELKINAHGGSAEQLALTTAQIYFPEPPVAPNPGAAQGEKKDDDATKQSN
jgi:hypothetical protein